MTETDTSQLRHRLRYVCKWCGTTVGDYPTIKTNEPATFSVCDKRECRDAASAEWKGTL